jgi:hypothetical protein
MRRLAIAGVIALGIASAVVVALVSGTAPPSTPAPTPEPIAAPAPPASPAESAAPAPAASAPERPPPAALPPPEPAPAAEPQEAPHEPAAAAGAAPARAASTGEPTPWEEVRPLPRGWPALVRKIAEAQPESLPCRDHLPLGRFRARSRLGQVADAGAPMLTLQLETVDGAVKIVDAPVARKGALDDGSLACVQNALRGLTLDMPGTAAGTRQRLNYLLR